MSDEERRFLHQELASPGDLESIAGQVDSLELARQVFTVSLLAIEVDTDAERQYLKSLADRLGLDDADVDRIYRELEIRPS